MTLGLKFLLWKNKNVWFQKKLLSDMFLQLQEMYSCETLWVKVLVSKGGLQSEITVQTL